MSGLTRVRQVFGAKEVTEGVAIATATLHTVGNAELAYDSKTDPDYEDLPRNPTAASASREKDEVGRRAEKIDFMLDLATLGGAADAVTEPRWGKYLEACGMQMQRTRSVAATGTVGVANFTHGEAFTGSAGAAGYVVGGYALGSSPTRFIYMRDGQSLANSETITGSVSGATLSVHGTADDKVHGYKYFPSTAAQVVVITRSGAVTGTLLEKEIVKGGTSNAVGRVLRPFDDHSGAGVVYLEPILGTFSAETLTGQDSAATFAVSGAAVSHSCGSLSLAMQDGIYIQARGCRGTWKLAMEAGKPIKLAFEFMGLYETHLDRTILPADPTFTSAHRFQSANVTIDALSLRLRNLAIDFSANLIARENASFSEGAESFRVAGREPTGSMDPEMVPKAAYDWRTKWFNLVAAVIKVRMGVSEANPYVSGYTLGKNLWIDVPQAQYSAVPFGDRDGVRTADASFRCKRDEPHSYEFGDDEVAIYVL